MNVYPHTARAQATICKVRAAVLASALMAAAVAQAASGYIVTAAQQTQIHAGMTRDEVRAELGRPAHNIKYPNEPGRTWTWGIQGTQDKVFDVDFSADGKVKSMAQRSENIPD